MIINKNPQTIVAIFDRVFEGKMFHLPVLHLGVIKVHLIWSKINVKEKKNLVYKAAVNFLATEHLSF